MKSCTASRLARRSCINRCY